MDFKRHFKKHFAKTINHILWQSKNLYILCFDFILYHLGKKGYQMIGFWDKPVNIPFTDLIPKSKYRLSKYKPHVIFFSVFTSRQNIIKSKAKVKIFFTGENVHSIMNPTNQKFNDHCIDIVDLALGFDEITHNKYIRFPLWILYYFWNTKTIDDVKTKVDMFNTRTFSKTKNFSLVASHDKSGVRTLMYNRITELDKIYCPGILFHNDSTLNNGFNDDKEEYLKQFRFNICPENEAVPGYVTEKLFQAFWSDCIPIYWAGDRYPEQQVINKNAFIWMDPYKPDDAIEQIGELIKNKNYYIKIKKNTKLMDGSVDWIYNKTVVVKNRILELISENNWDVKNHKKFT